MHAESASILVPSLLPDDVEEGIRRFACAIRDDVAIPLFSASSSEEFDAMLGECLVIGAIHRCRWIASLAELPSASRAEVENEWLRPPPQAFLQDLQVRAAELLGPERSFQVRRALGLTFSDLVENAPSLVARLQGSIGSLRLFRELTVLYEAVGPHDVLCLAWMMVLFGDAPTPTSDVAHHAASVLLDQTSRRLMANHAVMTDQITASDLVLDDRGTNKEWLEQHIPLMLPMILILGFAADDGSIGRVKIRHHVDPEDEGAAVLEICLVVRKGDPEAALLRLEDRALKAGVLGVLSDRSGAAIVLTTAVEDIA